MAPELSTVTRPPSPAEPPVPPMLIPQAGSLNESTRSLASVSLPTSPIVLDRASL